MLPWTAPVIARGAPHAARVVVEGALSASPAEPRGPPRGVLLALGRSPGVAAWLADGAALDGRPAAASRTTVRISAGVEAPRAALPGDAPASYRISAAIKRSGGPAGRVPGPLGLTLFLPARCAQTALGLERFPAALRAQPSGEALGGAPPVALTLVGARLLWILVTRLAGGPALRGAGAVGDSPLLVTGRAQTAIGLGRRLAALQAQPPGQALGGPSPEPFAVTHAAQIGVSIGHSRVPPTGFELKAG